MDVNNINAVFLWYAKECFKSFNHLKSTFKGNDLNTFVCTVVFFSSYVCRKRMADALWVPTGVQRTVKLTAFPEENAGQLQRSVTEDEFPAVTVTWSGGGGEDVSWSLAAEKTYTMKKKSRFHHHLKKLLLNCQTKSLHTQTSWSADSLVCLITISSLTDSQDLDMIHSPWVWNENKFSAETTSNGSSN